ncbi:serine hydrolase [Nonomuraea sp. bgisy101]|uniref:serine hydrolase n=1 Tax=Nonomuraea sp. bgisy101 TaxID=3413784 RepID=UPI003D748B15
MDEDTSWEQTRGEMTPADGRLSPGMRPAPASLAALREPQVESVPEFGGGVIGLGLGWMLHQDGVVGHTGVAKGQKAFLRVVPSAGVAVAVLTNSTGGEPLAYEIFGAVLRDLAGVETAPLPVPPLTRPGSTRTACAAPTAPSCTTSP